MVVCEFFVYSSDVSGLGVDAPVVATDDGPVCIVLRYAAGPPCLLASRMSFSRARMVFSSLTQGCDDEGCAWVSNEDGKEQVVLHCAPVLDLGRYGIIEQNKVSEAKIAQPKQPTNSIHPLRLEVIVPKDVMNPDYLVVLVPQELLD